MVRTDQMEFLDTHAHLYLNQFKNDIDQVIIKAKNAGIANIYLPNVDSSTTEALHKISDDYPDFLYPMMGIHPCSINEDYKKELLHAEEQLAGRKYIAIGEIGIDLYWDKTFYKEQKEAFAIQINWARKMDLPIIIHSRDSLDLTIDIVSENQNGGLKGIFHCFNGTVEQGKRIQDLGFYMGIGGIISYKNSGMKKVYRELSINHMVLETDSPYLTPTPYRGKRNESSYIPIVAEHLAESMETSIKEIAEITTKNGYDLFGTPKLRSRES